MTAPFRLIAWNIRAGGGVRCERISDAILGLGPDAVILSEFRSTPPSQQIADTLGRAGLHHQSTTLPEVPRGRNALLLASREPLRRVPLKDPPRESGRWRIVRLQRSRIVLGGMHVPNQHTGRKPHYHDAVLSIMRRWRGGPAIFAGDTNSGLRSNRR